MLLFRKNCVIICIQLEIILCEDLRFILGRYGGELTIGRISQELFDNLKYADEDVIIENFDGWDSDLAWHDIDDIEHITGPFADNEYDVFEVNSEDEEIAEVGTDLEYNGLYAREAYLYDYQCSCCTPRRCTCTNHTRTATGASFL